MVKVLTKKHKIVVFLLGFAGQLCWAIENQHFNLFMYNEISPKPIYVSLLVAFSAIASTITTIFIGALSDAKGKRKIFFVIGFAFWPITTALFPLSAFLGPVWLA
ncbi:MAG: MFS transporter, partial [Promethearchaeota archaeon]